MWVNREKEMISFKKKNLFFLIILSTFLAFLEPISMDLETYLSLHGPSSRYRYKYIVFTENH